MCMGKIILFSFFYLGLILTPPKLVKVKVDDRLTILIPKGWRPMDDLDFTERFPSVRAPLAAYSDESRLLDFSVNISATRWLEKDKALAQQFFKAGITNLFDRVDMISEGVADRNGKEFIFFEFESRVNGQPIRKAFGPRF